MEISWHSRKRRKGLNDLAHPHTHTTTILENGSFKEHILSAALVFGTRQVPKSGTLMVPPSFQIVFDRQIFGD
jgi:hypothetical protein